MNSFLITILVLAALCANILWYIVKDILKKNGYKVYYLFGHLNNIFELTDLIRRETNPELKWKYIRMKRALLVSIFLFLGVLITVIIRFEFFKFYEIF